MYRESSKEIAVVDKPVYSNKSWQCKIFGHKEFSINSSVDYYMILTSSGNYLYIGASYRCSRCLSIQNISFPLYSEHHLTKNYGAGWMGYSMKIFESYSEIQCFLQKCKFTRKKKWYESYDYEFFITKSKEKLALCLNTYNVLYIQNLKE